MSNCPRCNSKRIRKSRRKGVEEKIFFAMIFVRPFRCESCDHRFFRWAPSYLRVHPARQQPSE